jgi:hypothetical protein
MTSLANPLNTTTNAAIIPEIWSQKFLDTLHAKLPFVDSINKDYEGEIQGLGDIVNISNVPAFNVASALTEGDLGVAEAITIGTQQLTINTFAYKDVYITKQAQLQSLPFMDQVRNEMIYSLVAKVHADIITAIVPSATAPDHTIAYTSGTTLALADILAAKELLDAQNVSEMDRVGVLGSAQINDIFNITGFMSSDFVVAGSPLSSGAINVPLCGFNIKLSTLVSNTSYWFHPSFLTLAMQQGINVRVYPKNDGSRATVIESDVFYGIKQLANKRVVSIA